LPLAATTSATAGQKQYTRQEHQGQQQQKIHQQHHTDKKENQIFLIYEEIQNGAVA
jgi:hypothetical protein